LGREVAEKVAQLRSEEDQNTAARDRAATQAASWDGAVEARPNELATAAREALRKARIDRTTECKLVGVQCVPVQEDWPENAMQDPRLEYLDGGGREDPRLAGLEEGDPRGRHVCIFTDGSYESRDGRSGFGVALRRARQVGPEVVDVSTEGAPAAETLRGTAPNRYGSAKFTNHQAELVAAVVGLPRLPVGGDGLIVMDNQAVITIMQREGKLTARERSKANDNTLEPRLLHIARRIKEHASQEGGEGAWVRTVGGRKGGREGTVGIWGSSGATKYYGPEATRRMRQSRTGSSLKEMRKQTVGREKGRALRHRRMCYSQWGGIGFSVYTRGEW